MMSPSLEPQVYPLCAWCDGDGNVEVDTIIDVMGKTHDVTAWHYSVRSIPCPLCDATGLQVN